ncbi:hypothetical protein GCM10023350_21200 [Nocardioides endophyticus]|uniref:DUF3040 domain-containing protein n=1 Tax=Nocardioides endophyticus TaxID=1353775 RepID=A0ABP8YSV4_9ACTN
MNDKSDGAHIDWTRTVAGALAAVASAILLSTLGAVGTIIGAAVGSIVVTISSALFTQGLSSSKRSLAKAQASAMQKVGIAHAEVRRAERADDVEAQEGHLEHADERLEEAHEELDAAALAAAPPSWRERLTLLPWRRILLGAGVLFLIAVVVITVFEVIAGRSVSSFTGGSSDDSGTTITHVREGGPGRGDDPGPSDSPDPTDDASPSETPSESPGVSPTGEPTPSDAPTPSPMESSTPSPSETPAEPQVITSPTP